MKFTKIYFTWILAGGNEKLYIIYQIFILSDTACSCKVFDKNLRVSANP